MTRESWARRAAVAALLALTALHVTCADAPLTAVTGSTLSVFANPTFIPSSGGVSVISAVVTEPAGTLVPDGTVVQFFTTLGTIDREGKTHDGVARVNLVSDTRSGAADVTATSGAVTVMSAGLVTIGSALPVSVVVTANPLAIDGMGPTRQSRIVANVFDASGNPVPRVGTIFSVVDADTGNPSTEFMASGGAPIFTDSNGQAVDFLQTRYPRDSDCKNVTVTANTTNGISGTVNVVINSNVPPCTPPPATPTPSPFPSSTPTPTPTPTPSPTPTPAPVITSFNPTAGVVGTPVTLTGTGFTGVTNVTFFNSVGAFFTFISDTQINTAVPLGAIDGPISVTTPSGTGTSASNFDVQP